MLIIEVTGKEPREIIKEFDELDANLNAIIDLALDDEHSKYTLEQVFADLNGSTNVYFDIDKEERKEQITQKLEDQGLNVDRGSGEITKKVASDVDTEDPSEIEKRNKSAELAGKAMDSVKSKAEPGGKEMDGKL